MIPQARMPSGARAAAAALAIAAAACATDTRTGTFVERDSAGVRIVESRLPAWKAGDADAWRIDAPIVAEGTESGWIGGVVPLDDGGVAVLDAEHSTLRIHDAAGRLVRTVEPVDLPGIVYGMTRLYVSGGRIAAPQRGLQPTFVFDAHGNLVETIEPHAPARFPFIAVYRRMADGETIAMQPPVGLLPRAAEWTESAQFIRLPDDTGSAARVVSVPAARFSRVTGGVEPVGFGPVIAFDFTDSTIIAGFPSAWDIGTWTTDGRLIRRVRRDWQPVAVGAFADSLRDALRASLANRDEPAIPERTERLARQIDEIVVADSFPAFGRIIADDEGNLWVERIPPLPPLPGDPRAVRDTATPWDVFDPRGVWLGTIDMPPHVWIATIAGGRVAGVLREDARPERALTFRILRSATRSSTTNR